MVVLGLGACAEHGAEVVVLDLVLVLADELAPPLLALLALHLILVQCGGGVELGEVLLKVFVDFIVDLRQSQFGTWDFFKDLPVCLHVLHNCAFVLEGVAFNVRSLLYL